MDGIHPVVAQRSCTILSVLIDAELSCCRVESLQARGISAQPQQTLVVFDEVQIVISCQLIPPVGCKAITRGIKSVQPIVGSSPQCSIAVDEETWNDVIAEAVFISGVVSISFGPSSSSIKSEQPVTVCSNPKTS